ncbi:hypothetical protein B9Z55_001283 [Caenorhabditis nigoni]|uniref:RING-type domain-containing protein n=1 Tax=Caenorhabditis nigoni TaxID=1611254 RepID=A0A2G5VF21_9PELO|nr:hypothetical protein B9Z55_001283 [Caenorhabditis nigoni]
MSASCGICYDDYDSDEQIPCIGTCGHTICDRCRLLMQSSKCPHCNRKEAFAVKHVNKQLWDLIQFSNFVFGKSQNVEDNKNLKQCTNCGEFSKKLRVCRDCCIQSGVVQKYFRRDEEVPEDEDEVCEKIKSQAMCGDCIIDGEHFRHSTENLETFIDSYLDFLRNNKKKQDKKIPISMRLLMTTEFNPTTIPRKRTMDLGTMMIMIFFCFVPAFCQTTEQPPLPDSFTHYWQEVGRQGKDVDHSALRICYKLGGDVKHVDPSNHEKGYKCEGKTATWVADDKQAMDYCTSLIPYHIIEAKKQARGVSCTFRRIFHHTLRRKSFNISEINLKCENDWYQMKNKCYTTFPVKSGFEAAKDYCRKYMPEVNTKIAEYYSGHLSNFIKDLTFSEAWISDPEMELAYEGSGLAPVMLLSGAYKYDTRPGTVFMFDVNIKKERVLCEYTPPMTMAEMYLLAEMYSEIYPIHVTTTGAVFSTSNYLTIQQDGLKTNVKGEYAESFTTKNIIDRCKSIGNIISVDSHPIASIQEEFDTVQSFLKVLSIILTWNDSQVLPSKKMETYMDHRFHLTSAYKNAGCLKTTYQDWDFATETLFSVYKTVHQTKEDYYSFAYEYDDCEPGWVTAKRSKTTKFCHYIYTEKEVTHADAIAACKDLNSALTGFESFEEFEYVKNQFAPGKPGWVDHFWLGGILPCKEDLPILLIKLAGMLESLEILIS